MKKKTKFGSNEWFWGVRNGICEKRKLVLDILLQPDDVTLEFSMEAATALCLIEDIAARVKDLIKEGGT